MAVRLRNGHTHGLVSLTSVDLDHRHLVLHITDRAVVLSNGSHVHRIRSLTSFVREHAHAVSRYTGPGIPIGNTGTHYHLVEAVTTRNRDHRHRLRARTRRAPNIPASVIRAALS
ncbi:MAG: YmaF family protein [Bacillota bacterium]|jgi:hypothetical protein